MLVNEVEIFENTPPHISSSTPKQWYSDKIIFTSRILHYYSHVMVVYLGYADSVQNIFQTTCGMSTDLYFWKNDYKIWGSM